MDLRRKTDTIGFDSQHLRGALQVFLDVFLCVPYRSAEVERPIGAARNPAAAGKEGVPKASFGEQRAT